ncbi:MAG: ImmA/IrrE family metallo-endopeptidase [Beijerinckiaceae bacterium]
MSRHTYYEAMKALAREKRAAYGVATESLGLREIRSIYKAESIRIDLWPLPRRIKALYMCADGDCSVAIQASLPIEPKIFALMHELKHHYVDRDNLSAGTIACGDYNENELIEKGAEVFAAEFIYPEQEFVEDLHELRIPAWTPEQIVRLKRGCKAQVSYMYLCKRLVRMGLVARGEVENVQFRKLEDQLYGVPFYRRRRIAS